MNRRLLLLPIIAIVAGVGIFASLSLYHKHEPIPEDQNKPTNAQPLTEALTPQLIITDVNNERSKVGLQSYVASSQLTSSASMKCDDMVAGKYYDHANPITGFHGYEYIHQVLPNSTNVSENLNYGFFVSNVSVVDNWMGSQAHKEAILSTIYTQTGVAICDASSGINKYIVEHFADSPNVNPPALGTLCKDGWISPSSGQGTCSHHYGVAN